VGLSLSVGYLAEVAGVDPEGAQLVEEQFRKLNIALAHAGLEPHVEPATLPASQQISYQMWGYSGLHYLRRIAAYTAAGHPLPPPGDDSAVHDPLIEAYTAALEKPGGFLSQLFGKQQKIARSFDHLILHSDAEGYYVPQDFAEVIIPDDKLEIAGGMIGSAQRLQAECRQLAALLGLPENLDPGSDEVWQAADNPGAGKELWQRYGVESFCCIHLLHACRHSLSSGAALVFC
jgi:hypothetical protein